MRNKKESDARSRLHLLALVALLGRLAGEELGLDVWDDTTLADDDVAEELVQPEGEG